MAIDKLHFWDVNYYDHPPLTKEMIDSAESSLGVRLPPELIDLLLVQNGGYTRGFIHPTKKSTTWAKDHISFPELFGIVDPSFDTAQNILSTPGMTEEWGLPEKQVLLCGDGHWWITLDYRKSETPSVCWIDTELDQDIQISGTFSEFLDGLVGEKDFKNEQ